VKSVGGTDNVESAVVFFVEMIVRLKNVAMASSLHGDDLLLHFRISALVSHFENLRAVKGQRVQVQWAYLGGESL
jgi:hypothetical protein